MRNLLALLVLARAAFGQQSCVLEGRVVDRTTGQPIAKVQLFAISEQVGPAIRTKTNEHGMFCFAQMAAGSYGLLARRTGYLDAAYQGSRFFGTYPSLKIGPDSRISPVTLEMVPRSILAGRVVDSDGDPIAGAEVRASGPDGDEVVWRNPGNIAHTDVNGVFRFYDLDPGTYHLTAVPPIEARYWAGYRDGHGQPLQQREIETYYPNSPSADGAAPIVLKAGREITGIAITMLTVRLRHLSGKVVGLPIGKYLLADIRSPSGAGETRAIQLREDGTFYQDGLLPGLYTLRVTGAENRIVDLSAHDVDGLLIEPPKTSK
jgi:hypothetical protein